MSALVRSPAPALACPRCHVVLVERNAPRSLYCPSCQTAWPFVAGIPDLRTEADPYLSAADDAAAARALAQRAESGSFADVLGSYYEGNDLVPPQQARRIIRATRAAGERSRSFLSQASRVVNDVLGKNTQVLDVGTGTGPLAVELARDGADVWAVDIGLRWLALAHSRAADAAVTLRTACASARSLPFLNDSFDVVVAESLFELLTDQSAALREIHRVLRPGGCLLFATPNRWSPGPDPHLGLPLTSWLPAPAVAAVARLRGMLPPRRSLQSRASLRVLLNASGFVDVSVTPTEIPAAVRRSSPAWLRAGIAAFEGLRRLPVVGGAVDALAPVFVVVARRSP